MWRHPAQTQAALYWARRHKRRYVGQGTAAGLLLGSERDGFAASFTGGSLVIRDTTTAANVFNGVPRDKLTYTSPSPKMCMQSDGVLRYGAHNLYLNSAAPANQSVTVTSGHTYEIVITGSVSITWSSAYVGTTTAGTTAFTAASGTLTGGSTSGSGTVTVRKTPVSSAYLPTTSAAVYELPYEYTTAGVPLGVRVEEARTNLVRRSQELDNGTWTTSGVTVTANAGVSPDGTTTADRIVSSAGSIYQSVAVSASTSYTFSFYAKNNGGTIARYRVYDVTHGADIVALETSYFSQINSSTFTRVSVTFTTPAGCTNILIYPQSSSSSGADLLVWGAQLELGSTASSYIPTVAATVTRAADVLSLATSLFPYATTGTLFFKGVSTPSGITTDIRVGSLYGAGNARATDIYAVSNTDITTYSDPTSTLDPTTPVTSGGVFKVAVAIALNDYAACCNGGTVVTDISATPLVTATTLGIGNYAAVAQGLTIQQAMFLPRRMTNAELQTVTT